MSHAEEISRRSRFGPGPFLVLMPVIAAVMGGFYFLVPLPELLLMAAVGFLYSVLLVWNELVYFTVDAEGVRRRSIRGARFFAWDEMDRIRGIEVRDRSWPYRSGTAVHRAYVVVDAWDAPLFRIGPWIRHKHELCRLIRDGIRRAKEETPARESE